MRFTIDSMTLLQALKRLNVRRAMYPYIQIRASGGQLSLLSSTRPSRNSSEHSMQVSLQVGPATLDEEGSCAVPYCELLHVAKTLSGILAFHLQERALVATGEGPLLCQIPLRLLEHEFPETVFKELVENECYTKERSTKVECDACKHSHYAQVTATYRVTKVWRQQIRINRDLLAAMCAQVAWVAEPGESYLQQLTAIRFELKDDVFSLAAFDHCCFVIRRQIITGAGSWEYPVLVSAARLTQALRLLPKGEELLVETAATQHQLIKYGDKDVTSSEPLVQENEVSLATETMCINLSPIVGEFPNFQAKVLSSLSSPAIRVVCCTDKLARAVNAMVPLDSDEDGFVWFTCGPTKLQIKARRDQLGSSAQYEVPINPDATEATVILDSGYVSSLLKATTAPEVSFACTDPHSVVLFHSGGERDEYLVGLAPGKA